MLESWFIRAAAEVEDAIGLDVLRDNNLRIEISYQTEAIIVFHREADLGFAVTREQINDRHHIEAAKAASISLLNLIREKQSAA